MSIETPRIPYATLDRRARALRAEETRRLLALAGSGLASLRIAVLSAIAALGARRTA
ncbi:MAG: hypothetical protein AAF675_05965 [Pseudomonadota bacterium]